MTTIALPPKILLLTAALLIAAVGCSWMPFVGGDDAVPTPTFPPIPTFAPTDVFTLTVRAEPVNAARFVLDPEPGQDGTYSNGEVVTIAAILAPGWELLQWEGNLFGNTGEQANINMDQHQVVLVQMQQLPTVVPPPTSTPPPTPTQGPTATPAPTPLPPAAMEDAYTSQEDELLLEADPGVLANDSDPHGGPLTAVLVREPFHGELVLRPEGGFVYNPEPNFTGKDDFIYRAVSRGSIGSFTAVGITISPVNDPPRASSDEVTTKEEVPVTVDVLHNDSDPESNELSVTEVTDPSNGSASVVASTNEILYLPDADFVGSDFFTYTISDGEGGSANGVARVTVTNLNDKPVGVSDSAVTKEDTPVEINVIANDLDVDGDALHIVDVVFQGQGLVGISGSDTVRYIPPQDFNGTVSFEYTLTDGKFRSLASASAFITVTPVNDPVNATDDEFTVDEDSSERLHVIQNDVDPDGDDVVLISVSSAARGDTAVFPDNRILYVPPTEETGTDTFTYMVSDGKSAPVMATVLVTIRAVNDPPYVASFIVSTSEDTAVDITPLERAFDQEGDALTLHSVTQGEHGAVTIVTALDTPTSIRYTPDQNFFGTDAFTYTVTDSQNGSSTASITVTVSPVNDAPTAVPDSASTTQGTLVSIEVLSNDYDIDGDNVVLVGAESGAGGTAYLDSSTNINFIPDPGTTGMVTFTYTITDGNAVATGTVTVTVT